MNGCYGCGHGLTQIAIVDCNDVFGAPRNHSVDGRFIISTRHRDNAHPAVDDSRKYVAIESGCIHADDRHAGYARIGRSQQIRRVNASTYNVHAACRVREAGHE